MEVHKKLYEEALVKEIMISTALYVQDLLYEESEISEEELCQFIEEQYQNIIEDALSQDYEEDDLLDKDDE